MLMIIYHMYLYYNIYIYIHTWKKFKVNCKHKMLCLLSKSQFVDVDICGVHKGAYPNSRSHQITMTMTQPEWLRLDRQRLCWHPVPGTSPGKLGHVGWWLGSNPSSKSIQKASNLKRIIHAKWGRSTNASVLNHQQLTFVSSSSFWDCLSNWIWDFTLLDFIGYRSKRSNEFPRTLT